MSAILLFVTLIVLVSNMNAQTYSLNVNLKKSGSSTKILIDEISKIQLSQTGTQIYSLNVKLKKSGSTTKLAVADIAKITLNSFIVSLSSLTSPTYTGTSINSATLGANVISDGNSTITERGIVWSTNINPTITSYLGKKSATGTTGQFTINATGLSANTLYHFRGYAVNSLGVGYTQDTTFTTLFSSLSTPTLIYPEKDSYGISSSLTFKWGTVTGANSYELKIATDSSFTNIISNNTGIKGATKNISGLISNIDLHWKVRGVKSGDTSLWSKVWSFKTASTSLTKPIIIYPPNNRIKVSIDPILTWDTVTGATGYEVVLSDKLDMSNVLFFMVDLDSLAVSLHDLAYNKTYYWKALARNDTSTSEWTSVYKFSTHGAGVGVQSQDVIAENYSLSQNYPNPFNPSTIINYTISEPSLVTIKIFDVYGREIETLVNETQSIGKYSATWRPRSERGGVSSGVYFYRLKAGKFCETRKMLFVR